jgi:2-methylcitrate dehydratase PrpD
MHNLKPDDVEQIQCEVARFCLDSAGQKEPKTGLAGKFSVYYCAALALTEGVAGEDRFTDKLVLDPKMVALRRRVKAIAQPGLKDTEAKATVVTRRGKRYSAFVDRPKGDPRNPPTDEELECKFRTLAAFVLPKRRINLLAKILWNLEKVEDIRQVIRLCH